MIFLNISRLMLGLCILSAASTILNGQTDDNNGPFSAPKPNIIFILVDDMGWGDVGVFWQNRRKEQNDRAEPWQLTPALDDMAARGVMLSSHYCAAPVCAPSRASLLLGVSQGHANVRNNQFDKALQDTYTLGSVLQEAGYHTAAIGKWGLQGEGEAPNWPAHPLNRGFDYYLGYIRHRDGHEHYPKEGLYRGPKEVWENKTNISDQLDKCFTTDIWTASAKKYITDRVRDQDEKKPFFLYLAYDVPHAVLELPTQKYPEGQGLNGGLQWTSKPGQMLNTASGTIDSYIYPEYETATYDHDRDPATPEVKWPETYQRYATSCRRIDEGIADLMALLEDLGIDDQTLIVFTSDNGPSREDYLPEPKVPNEPTFFNSFGPFDGIKRDLWEGGVRVPTIVKWPDQIPAGRVIDEPSAMYDWLPTFAEAAGIPVPARSDGSSLLPLLSGTGKRENQVIYIEYENNQKTPDYEEFDPNHRSRVRQQMQKIRMGDLVGVRYNILSHDDNFEIYNVAEDPQETHNLAKDPAFAPIQSLMKRKVLQVRHPDPNAPRPYDFALVAGILPTQLHRGLQWKTYEGPFPWVADPGGMAPVNSGFSAQPAVSEMQGKEELIVFSGLLKIPENGRYQFSFESNGPVVMWLHESMVIDGSHHSQPMDDINGSAALKAGFHPFRIYFLKKGRAQPEMQLKWQRPGMEIKPVPEQYFYYE